MLQQKFKLSEVKILTKRTAVTKWWAIWNKSGIQWLLTQKHCKQNYYSPQRVLQNNFLYIPLYI